MISGNADGLTKSDYLPVGSLVGALRSQFENWLTLGALSGIALPTRCPPRAGWPRLARLPVEVRLRNRVRARCRLDEFSGFVEVWVYREYEVPGLRWNELRNIVDVGANVGAATLWFASRAPYGRIVAVEPAPAVLPSLMRNVEANGLGNRVEVVPVALGATSGIGYLKPSSSSLSASVGAGPTTGGLPVPIVSLGQLLEKTKIRKLDLLKLDCEGSEFEILRSSETSVLRSIRAIVGEFHASLSDDRSDLEQVLLRSGFDCRFRGSDNLGLFSAVRTSPRARANQARSPHHAARSLATARRAVDSSVDRQTPMTAAPLDVPPHVGDERPRALVVTFGSVLDPRSGWGVRARSVVEALADLGLRVSVISHYEPAGILPSSIDAIHILRRTLHLGWSRELVREARLRAREADVIIVESALLLPAVQAGRPTAPILWDTTECETLHYSRLEPTLSHRLRGFVWRQIERWAVRHTDLVIAISETDVGWWTRLFPASSRKLVVVPHRSLAQPTPYDDARPRLEHLCNGPLRGPALLFVGNLAAKHNAAAAEWLAAELAPHLPADCSLVLAGPGTETVCARDRTRARVVCLGGVPDIDVVIAGADVCLAPLAAGAGVKTKVLDYLAHGKVVLATPVAMEGLEGAPGVHTAELEHFAARLLDYLSGCEDRDAARRRAQSQRAWVRARHGPEQVADRLRAALERVEVRVP